jgi:hypothetical protein
VAVLSTSLICIVSLINLAPAIGALSPKRLQALNGIAFEEPNLVASSALLVAALIDYLS